MKRDFAPPLAARHCNLFANPLPPAMRIRPAQCAALDNFSRFCPHCLPGRPDCPESASKSRFNLGRFGKNIPRIKIRFNSSAIPLNIPQFCIIFRDNSASKSALQTPPYPEDVCKGAGYFKFMPIKLATCCMAIRSFRRRKKRAQTSQKHREKIIPYRRIAKTNLRISAAREKNKNAPRPAPRHKKSVETRR